ncbi:hypothetical protein [Ornithinimicrobium cavernae]|uniref:hypothetical protein n=1 Tax=Ornithinimicrobium cavernae TaxID=2666047 RepID=UPI0012B16C27|nr:hypothetical protein [Ornithinimicrobium cavernae]
MQVVAASVERRTEVVPDHLEISDALLDLDKLVSSARLESGVPTSWAADRSPD